MQVYYLDAMEEEYASPSCKFLSYQQEHMTLCQQITLNKAYCTTLPDCTEWVYGKDGNSALDLPTR